MNDKELRGIVLWRFYERRRENDSSLIVLTADDFDDSVSRNEVISICGQLAEKGLIQKWQKNMQGSGPQYGRGRISAFGVDVIEGSASSPIAITIDQSRRISVSESNNVQIGDSNTMDLSNCVNQISQAIESSSGSEEEKREAKSRLKRLLSHPLVAAVVGGLTGGM